MPGQRFSGLSPAAPMAAVGGPYIEVGLYMRTRRLFAWISTALGAVVIAFPGVLGHAAGDPSLVTAARADDLTAVRALIAKRANVNEPARDGSTALLWAVYHANAEMARALLAAGAPVNTPNHYGVTPLLQASRYRRCGAHRHAAQGGRRRRGLASRRRDAADGRVAHRPRGRRPAAARGGLERQRRRPVSGRDGADVGGGGRSRGGRERRCWPRAPIRTARRTSPASTSGNTPTIRPAASRR